MSDFEENALTALAGAAAAGVQAAIYIGFKAEGEMHPAVERVVGVGVPLALWSVLAIARRWQPSRAVAALWTMFAICGIGYAVLLAWRNDRYRAD